MADSEGGQIDRKGQSGEKAEDETATGENGVTANGEGIEQSDRIGYYERLLIIRSL